MIRKIDRVKIRIREMVWVKFRKNIGLRLGKWLVLRSGLGKLTARVREEERSSFI